MNLFDAAMGATESEFRIYAVDWLNRRIGFDGVIWGGGSKPVDGSLAITSYFLNGRPTELIADYPIKAAADPVSLKFIESPHTLQTVSTHNLYRTPELTDMRDYLEHYKIRQLQLMGVTCPEAGTYDWLVFYREDNARVFRKDAETMTTLCMSMALQGAKLRATAAECNKFVTSFERQHLKLKNAAALVLTERQHQVLFLLAKGWPNKLISAELGISENTLKTHLAVIYRLLDVNSRTQAVLCFKAHLDRFNRHQAS